MTDREIMQPASPPECYTEEEKTAYAFGWWKAMEAQRLAQPEQEPVVWEDVLGAIARGWTHDDNKHKTMDVQLAVAIAKEIQDMVIAPPQRTWVGLTDEEIHRTTVVMGFNPEWTTEIGVAHAIVRNLEAKLKERNT